MQNEILALGIAALSIGFIHTIFGPDHYLPFIMIARARKWSISKTLIVTFLCGMGHVLSSVIIGLIGIAFGLALSKLEWFEGFLGNIAGWLLLGFGLAYFAWGIVYAYRNKKHEHIHVHEKENVHVHLHAHENGHVHVHEEKGKKNITPWVLFIIFIFGPCEPLIPLLMYPAAMHHAAAAVAVALLFALSTVGTMLIVVGFSYFGIKLLAFEKAERYVHAIAGFTILLSGAAVKFLGM